MLKNIIIIFKIFKVMSKNNSFTVQTRFHTDLQFLLQHLLIRGRMDRASASEGSDSGSIPDRVKPKTAFFRWRFSNRKKQCKVSTVCGRQLGGWQLDSKTARFLRCVLAKATWRKTGSKVYINKAKSGIQKMVAQLLKDYYPVMIPPGIPKCSAIDSSMWRNINGWLQIFLSCIMVFINVFTPPLPCFPRIY